MKAAQYKVSGNIVDVVNQRIFKGTITVSDRIITQITEEHVDEEQYILPGFIDSHIHIESSMLIPSEFARLAVVHGTIATVSDPHEIANVLGIDGVRFMIDNGNKVPFYFNFGAPSCVPATPFETSGATISVNDVDTLMQMPEVKYLGEMMNFPGVLFQDADVMAKIAIAKKYNKPVDGHAPGLNNDDARKYSQAGITTDHECFSQAEATDKINNGMIIQIREGSAARNFDELVPLLSKYPDNIMLCSDDKHPDDLVNGHVNILARRAVAKGINPMTVVRALSLIPVNHYNLSCGLLQQNDPADFIVVNNISDFNVMATYIKGEKVAEDGLSFIKSVVEAPLNTFEAKPLLIEDLKVKAIDGKMIRVIEAMEGQLITNCKLMQPLVINGNVESDTSRDILKMLVYNRYSNSSKPAIAFINNIGLKQGAIASTVAHDSHNIIAVGTNDEDLQAAINLLIEHKGGIAAVSGSEKTVLPLPFAGLMSGENGYETARLYEAIDKKAKEYEATLKSPFMTLSFMALLVIPSLKLSDKGLFSGDKFEFVDLFE